VADGCQRNGTVVARRCRPTDGPCLAGPITKPSVIRRIAIKARQRCGPVRLRHDKSLPGTENPAVYMPIVSAVLQPTEFDRSLMARLATPRDGRARHPGTTSLRLPGC
jgi:hypothetical protein